MVKIDNTHANNSSKGPKPLVLCGPAFLEVHNVLVFLVMIIYKWKTVINEVETFWSWNVSPYKATNSYSNFDCYHFCDRLVFTVVDKKIRDGTLNLSICSGKDGYI